MRLLTILTGAIAAVLLQGEARAQLAPAAGYTTREIATSMAGNNSYQLDSLVYNPDLDSFLTINEAGFDSIFEITRTTGFATAASTFGLGGLWRDDVAVAAGLHQAYVIEGHAREVYRLTPAGVGGQKFYVGALTRDPNGNQCPEITAAEVDGSGDLIAAFGPGFSSASICAGTPAGVPTDWFRVTSTGSTSFLFQTRDHVFLWLARDPSSATRMLALDVYDVSVQGFMNFGAPRLLSVDIQTGSVSVVRQYSSVSLTDLEVDRSRLFHTTDVIWAIGGDRDILPLDPATGAPAAPIASATGSYRAIGIAVAPATLDPHANSVYVLVSEDIQGTSTVKLIEIEKTSRPPDPGTTTGGTTGLTTGGVGGTTTGGTATGGGTTGGGGSTGGTSGGTSRGSRGGGTGTVRPGAGKSGGGCTAGGEAASLGSLALLFAGLLGTAAAARRVKRLDG